MTIYGPEPAASSPLSGQGNDVRRPLPGGLGSGLNRRERIAELFRGHEPRPLPVIPPRRGWRRALGFDIRRDPAERSTHMFHSKLPNGE